MFITPPPPDTDEEIQIFFGETGSVSSIDRVEGGHHHDSANSLNFESTRRPDSYVVDSTSESDTGFTITLKKTKTKTDQPKELFSRMRRLAESAALETLFDDSDDSFMNDRTDSQNKKRKTYGKKTTKKMMKKTTWKCHICGPAA